MLSDIGILDLWKVSGSSEEYSFAALARNFPFTVLLVFKYHLTI